MFLFTVILYFCFDLDSWFMKHILRMSSYALAQRDTGKSVDYSAQVIPLLLNGTVSESFHLK